MCNSFEKNYYRGVNRSYNKSSKKELNINKIALAGGVSANSYIRSEFLKLKDKGYDIYYPEPILCTDNAAMIASAGYYTYMTGNTSDLSLNAVPNLGIN